MYQCITMTNVNGNGPIKFSLSHYRHIWTRPFQTENIRRLPKENASRQVSVSRAGLYYMVKSDICQCFRCHVKLSSWERDDNAIKEHFKWPSNCEYMKMVAAPPPQQPGFMLGSSVSSFGGFGRRGSSNMMKYVDPNVFQHRREHRNDVM